MRAADLVSPGNGSTKNKVKIKVLIFLRGTQTKIIMSTKQTQ